MRGAWQLRGFNGPVELYTDVCADIYVNCETNEEYLRGERKLFECGAEQVPLPELIETTGKYKFLLKGSSSPWTAEDSLREIMVQGILK